MIATYTQSHTYTVFLLLTVCIIYYTLDCTQSAEPTQYACVVACNIKATYRTYLLLPT